MIKKYKVSHLDCASCAQKIEDILNKQEDIIECSLSFANGLLLIESDQEIKLDRLLSIVQKLEPDVMIEDKDSHKYEHKDECNCGHEHHEHEECSCGDEHHEHEECGCGDEHHEHEECGCGHEHHEHEEC
ncbi:MAG: heavy metal-associated domain-containing protein, partial [Coprobacillus sp.]